MYFIKLTTTTEENDEICKIVKTLFSTDPTQCFYVHIAITNTAIPVLILITYHSKNTI